jgi:acetyl-CoA carboxylase carboxyltransferase component
MDDKHIERLRAARGERADAARPQIVTRLHAGGKLTARERLARLMDPDSDVAYGTIAAFDPKANPDSPIGQWVAETGGLDAFCTIDGQPAIVSTTDYTDRGGGYGAARLGRLFATAKERRWPLVLFVDGGGSRARHPRAGLGHVELSGAIGPYTVFDGMAELSGWVPTISIVSGPSFAGHASMAGFSDIVIATRGSAIGMGGPPMVEAALGKKLTPHELSSAEMQFANGGIELLVDDEHAAIASAKRCLAYWRDSGTGRASSDAARIAELVPDRGPYDVHPVIGALVDDESFTELRAAFAPSLVTGFARMGGRSIGVLASNPAIDDGAIDELAAQKIVRHVELCDAWDLPMLVLIDTIGTLTRWTDRTGAVTREPGQSRLHMRAVVAHQSRTVPLFSVQIRHGRGIGPALMTGYSTGTSVPVLTVAWPTAELDRADGWAMVRDANAFDDIVEPTQTREMILRLLRHLPKESGRRDKKRPVDSW